MITPQHRIDFVIYIVPSRGRPHKALELLKAWRDTTVRAKLVFALDADDPELVKYTDTIEAMDGHYVIVPEGVSCGGMVGPLNYALRHVDLAQTIGFMGDDHRPRTQNWDVELHETMLTQRGLFAYGDDLVQRERLPTAILMDGRVIDRLGYMAPPCLIHLYVDDYWKALGQRTNSLVYVPSVVIEHMHPTAGKADWDDEYKRVNAGSMYANDGAAFQLLKSSGELDRDAEKIKELL